MTLEIEKASGETRPRLNNPPTVKFRLIPPAIQPLPTRELTPFFSPANGSGETGYSFVAIDPEVDSASGPALNPYSKGFFACWLLGFLVAAGAHFV